MLVDAECTHDGSIKHLAKFAQWGWSTFERRFLDADRLQALATLQLGLLRSGFRALRLGGGLIYSTCSFAKAQNEEIVSALLRDEPDTPLLAPLRPSEPLEDDGEASWFELEYQKSKNRSSWSSWLSAVAARSIALSLLAPSPQPWARVSHRRLLSLRHGVSAVHCATQCACHQHDRLARIRVHVSAQKIRASVHIRMHLSHPHTCSPDPC